MVFIIICFHNHTNRSPDSNLTVQWIQHQIENPPAAWFWIQWLLLTFFGWHFLTWDLCCQHNIIKLWILVELSGFQATRISTSLVQRLPNSQLPKGASFKKLIRTGILNYSESEFPTTFSKKRFRFLNIRKKVFFFIFWTHFDYLPSDMKWW